MKNENLVTEMPRISTPHGQTKVVLHHEHLECTVLVLESTEDCFVPASEDHERLLFVLAGEISAEMDGITHLLGTEEAMLVPKRKAVVLLKRGDRPGRLLRTEIQAPDPEPNPLLMTLS